MFLILIAIGWLYVALMMAVAEATSPLGSLIGALMMAVAEATSPLGSLIGALMTFLLYGAGPVALTLYILGTPARKKLRRLRASQQPAPAPGSAPPDAGGQTPADAVAPVREKP